MAKQTDTPRPAFSRQWQLPVFALGILVTGWGLVITANLRRTPEDIERDLKNIEASIDNGQFEYAWGGLDKLEGRQLPDDKALFGKINLFRADARFLGQEALVEDPSAWDMDVDHAEVVQSYEKAEHLLGDVPSRHVLQWARSVMRLGRADEALDLISRAGEDQDRYRQILLREMIESALAVRPISDVNQESAGRVIALMEKSLRKAAGGSNLSDEHLGNEIWTAGRRAEWLLRPAEGRSLADQAKDLEQAELGLSAAILVNKTSRAMLGELRVLLAEVYRRTGKSPSAVEERLGQAELALKTDDLTPDRRDLFYGRFGHQGEVELGRALIKLPAGVGVDKRENQEAALNYLNDAIAGYPNRSSEGRARVVRVEALARLDRMDDALRDMRAVVDLYYDEDRLGKDESIKALLRERARGIYAVLAGRDRHELALQFLEQERQLFDRAQLLKERMHMLPVDLLERFARSHESLAQKKDPLLKRADPGSKERMDAQSHRKMAGDFYHEHSHATSAENEALASESLWRAAIMYELAADADAAAAKSASDPEMDAKILAVRKTAIDTFTEHFRNRPADPKRSDAMYRLAMLHMQDGEHRGRRAKQLKLEVEKADGAVAVASKRREMKRWDAESKDSYRDAIETFGQLDEFKPNSPAANKSRVPWALAYLKLGSRFIEQARQRLEKVARDDPSLSLESAEYREAKIELGDLYGKRQRDGDFRRAVDEYKVVLDQDRRVGLKAKASLLFRVGDARRRAVQQLDDYLVNHAQPPKQRKILLGHRDEHFREAQKMFGEVIAAYKAKLGESMLTPKEAQQYRSSFFFRADSAFELGKSKVAKVSRDIAWGQAAELYKEAALKFPKDPMSLIAEIQLYNIYKRLNQPKEAASALHRAKEKLASIPADKFEKDPSVLTREHWKRWLDWAADRRDDDDKISNAAGAKAAPTP
jgi:tetratricopeptide (TPR) repeat protein